MSPPSPGGFICFYMSYSCSIAIGFYPFWDRVILFYFKPQKKINSHIFQRFLDDNEIVYILGKNLFIFIYDHLIAYYWFYCKIWTKKNSICFLLKYFLIIRVGFKFFFLLMPQIEMAWDMNLYIFIGDESDSE